MHRLSAGGESGLPIITGPLNGRKKFGALIEQFYRCQADTLVMDNLNTHAGASLYKAFEPQIARALLDKLEFVYPPKHGSWLNMVECEFSVLGRQRSSRRLPDLETVRKEVGARCVTRNQAAATVDWRFTTDEAQLKLKRVYLAISNRCTARPAKKICNRF